MYALILNETTENKAKAGAIGGANFKAVVDHQ